MKLFLFLIVAIVINAAAQDLPPQITPEQAKNIKAATPTLPQTPVVKRPTTNAQENNLRGRVQRVVLERQDLSSTWKTQGRHFDSIEYYDENGSLVTRVSFYEGHPSDVTGYGFVKGMRVSDRNTVSGHQVLSGAMTAEERELFKPTRESDPSFNYEYRFTYEKDQLSGKDVYMSDGSLWQRTVFKRSPNALEELVYSNDGKLNQKYVSKFDERGNEVETLNVAVINQWRGDRKYIIKYESFDKNGNWTKRVKLQVITEDGKEVLKPWYASYRTITYHRN